MTQVLVVDDDAAIRESLSLALVDEFDVTTASSAEEALDHLTRERPEVMVLDQYMPGMSGLGLLEQLGGMSCPGTIMLSALVDVDMARQAMHLGANDLMAKPYDLEMLKQKLRAAAELQPRGRHDGIPLALRVARTVARAVAQKGTLPARSLWLSRTVAAEAVSACRGDRALAAERLDISTAELNALIGDASVDCVD
jgi:DNA-binding NtrC family response regulator